LAGTIKKFGPLALLTVLTTNIFQGGFGGSAVTFDVIRHIHIVNKTGAAATFSLWLGASGANAAGTEIFNGHSIPANSTFDYYCALRLDSTIFLVGGSNTATALTLILELEEYVI